MAAYMQKDSEGNEIYIDTYDPGVRLRENKDISKDFEPAESERQHILSEAERCICSDRQNQYGPPEDSFAYIAELWNAYIRREKHRDVSLKPSDVARMMILLKVARTSGHKEYSDNYVDIAGYSALAAELGFNEWAEDQRGEYE